MSNSFIRNFTSFQKKRNTENPLIESVKVINDRFIVGGIELKQSVINSYIKKVKDATGQDLNNSFSKEEIAEQLVTYLIDTHGDVDNIPPSALLGGDEEMVDQVEDVSMEEDDVEVGEEGMSEFEDDEEQVADDEEQVADDEDMDMEDDTLEEEGSEDDDSEFQDIDEEGEEELDIDEEVADEETIEDEDDEEDDGEEDGEEDELPL